MILRWACTPPGEISPIRWQMPPLACNFSISPVIAGLVARLPSAIATPIRGRSCMSDTAGADIGVADLGVAHLALRQPDIEPRRAQEGEGRLQQADRTTASPACRIALSAASSRHPQPSRMTNMTGRRWLGCRHGALPMARRDLSGQVSDPDGAVSARRHPGIQHGLRVARLEPGHLFLEP